MKRDGFTLIEMMISLTIGLIVIGIALGFAVNQSRHLEGSVLRDEVHRNARFISVSLERDLQRAGVGIASTMSFGVVNVKADTVIILYVPFSPDAPPYELFPPAGVNNPLVAGGTCGARCVDLKKVGGTFDLVAGDLARLQVVNERRLVLLENVTNSGAGDGTEAMSVTFTDATALLGFEAGFSGGILLDRFGTFAQQLDVIIYYLDGNAIMRADKLNPDGSPDGKTLAYGVQSFDVLLKFADGRELDAADATDTDSGNDFDDISGIRIVAELAADRVDIRVNGGALYTRTYQWMIT